MCRTVWIFTAAAIVGSLPLFILIGAFLPPGRLWNFLIPGFGVATGLGLFYIAQLFDKRQKAIIAVWLFIPVIIINTGVKLISSNSIVENMSGDKLSSPPIAETLHPILQEGDLLLGDGITWPTMHYLRRELSNRGLKFHLEEMHPNLIGNAGRICLLGGCRSVRHKRSYLLTRQPIENSLIYYQAIREAKPRPKKAKLIKNVMEIRIFVFEN